MPTWLKFIRLVSDVYQGRGRISLEVNLNVGEGSEPREVVVEVGDRVEGRRNVPDGKLASQVPGTGPHPTGTSASAASPTSHRSTAASEPVEVEPLLRRVRVDLGRQLVKRTLPVSSDNFRRISGGRQVDRRKTDRNVRLWKIATVTFLLIRVLIPSIVMYCSGTERGDKLLDFYATKFLTFW